MIARAIDHGWVVMTQPDHARLAASIAESFQFDWAAVQLDRDEFLASVRWHDEGWLAWSPTRNDAGDGPRNFLDMSLVTSTSLWEESVSICARHTALGGLWVSRHFCELAERGLTSPDHGEVEQEACRAFLAQQASLQAHWLDALARTTSGRDIDMIVESGTRLLQAFDRLSLWLCMDPSRNPLTLDLPGLGSMEWRALSGADEEHSGRSGVRQTIEMSPATAFKTPVTLRLPALRIDRRAYASDAELIAGIEAAEPVEHEWRLQAH